MSIDVMTFESREEVFFCGELWPFIALDDIIIAMLVTDQRSALMHLKLPSPHHAMQEQRRDLALRKVLEQCGSEVADCPIGTVVEKSTRQMRVNDHTVSNRSDPDTAGSGVRK